MGVITDVFAATDEEIQDFDPEAYVGDLFPTLQSNGGAGVIELAALESLLTGRDENEILGNYELAVEASEEGPWITRVPMPLQDALIELDEVGLDEIAQRWSKTDQFKHYDWSDEDVAYVLRGLWSLARQARDDGRVLFVLNAA
jgi:hypothetical protein